MSRTTKARIAAAITAIGLAGGIVACSDHNDGYRNCPDWQCGDGLFMVPYIIPAHGIYGQPGYVAPVTIQPGAPNYRPTYYGKPPNFTPPSGAKVNPPGQKPPPNYKPPTGSTLTVQKAPQKSGNTMPSQKPPSGSTGGSRQTVQKAPSGSSGSSKSGSSGSSSSGGSRSSSGGSSSSGRSK